MGKGARYAKSRHFKRRNRVIWKEQAFVWGAVIAASQLADALKEVFPFTKIHRAASEHTIGLDSMFIDALLEWENIFSGKYSDEQISNRRHKLMKLQHDAERKAFPAGLPVKEKLFAAAQVEAREFFAGMYAVEQRVGRLWKKPSSLPTWARVW